MENKFLFRTECHQWPYHHRLQCSVHPYRPTTITWMNEMELWMPDKSTNNNNNLCWSCNVFICLGIVFLYCFVTECTAFVALISRMGMKWSSDSDGGTYGNDNDTTYTCTWTVCLICAVSSVLDAVHWTTVGTVQAVNGDAEKCCVRKKKKEGGLIVSCSSSASE